MLESTLTLHVSVSPVIRPRRIWLYNNADFENINKMLSSTDWSSVSTASDINQAWAAWKSIFMSVIDKEVPSHLANPSSRVAHPWIDAKLKALIKQKRSAWQAFKRYPSPAHQSAFRVIRNKVTSALRSAEKQYLLSLHRDIRVVNCRAPYKASGDISSVFQEGSNPLLCRISSSPIMMGPRLQFDLTSTRLRP